MKSWVVLLVLAACDRGVATTDRPELFARYCAVCHGATGRPAASMIAQLNVRDLTAPEFRARLTPELVEAQVRNGSQNKLMPAFNEVLSAAQIKAVSAWVADPTFVRPP